MTKYAQPLDRRFGGTLTELLRRVKKLETRTVAIDSGAPLAALPGVVDTASPLMVFINGASAATGPCQYLASYTPTIGDTVLVIPTPLTAPAASSYVVVGKLI